MVQHGLAEALKHDFSWQMLALVRALETARIECRHPSPAFCRVGTVSPGQKRGIKKKSCHLAESMSNTTSNVFNTIAVILIA